MTGSLNLKPVQPTDLLQLALVEIKRTDVEVLRKTVLVVALGDDCDISLRSPPEQDLRGSLAVLGSDALDNVVVKEERCVLCPLHVQLDEALGSERRVGSDVNVVGLAQLDKTFLGEVRVVLNLQSRGDDAGVAQEVENQGAVVV